MKMPLSALLAGLLLFVPCSLALAEDNAVEHDDSVAHVALFSGATIHNAHASPTAGVEAEYYLPGTDHLLGAGPVIESVFDTHTIGLAAALLTVHPLGGLRILAGPGVETADGHTAFLVRGGVGYDFHIGDFSLCPLASLDYVDDELVQVYGLAFGLGL